MFWILKCVLWNYFLLKGIWKIGILKKEFCYLDNEKMGYGIKCKCYICTHRKKLLKFQKSYFESTTKVVNMYITTKVVKLTTTLTTISQK